MKGTFTVHGVKVRTQSTRRFVAFAVRPETGKADVLKRSDKAGIVVAFVRRFRPVEGVKTAIVDTVTGEVFS